MRIALLNCDSSKNCLVYLQDMFFCIKYGGFASDSQK